MSLLRVLALAGELAGRSRQELLTVGALHFRSYSAQCLAGERHAVGSHVGDVATLVETLRDTHDLGRTEAQLAATLLLQGAGHERCLGAAAVRLLLHRSNGEVGGCQCGGQ